MDDPISDLAAVTAVAVMLKAAGVHIFGISMSACAMELQIRFEQWPKAVAHLEDRDGCITRACRQTNDQFRLIYHRLTLPNQVAIIAIEERSTNAA